MATRKRVTAAQKRARAEFARKYGKKRTAAPKRRARRRTAVAAPRRRAKRGASRRVVRLRRGNVALVNRRRRTYRRNPGFSLGFNKETLKTVGYAASGFLGVPFVEGFIANYLPASIKTGTTGKLVDYGVKIGAAYGLKIAADKVLGGDAGRKVFIGGLTYVAIAAIRDFFPSLTGGGTTSTGAYLRAQPMLGSYQRSMGSYITNTVPSRLQPQARY